MKTKPTTETGIFDMSDFSNRCLRCRKKLTDNHRKSQSGFCSQCSLKLKGSLIQNVLLIERERQRLSLFVKRNFLSKAEVEKILDDKNSFYSYDEVFVEELKKRLFSNG